ncbi:MAG: hypothetical protein AB1450_08290 [Pseudomonadota bacterium]
MTNIDRFNECAAKLFSRLYAEFPKPCGVNYFEFLGKDVFEAGDDELEFCRATLEWLENAGYITVDAHSNDCAYNVVLTAKGLETLKAVPDSLKGKGSIGDAMVAAVKAGSIEMAKQLASKAFTEGFKLIGL